MRELLDTVSRPCSEMDVIGEVDNEEALAPIR